jgi:hypothetical protein
MVADIGCGRGIEAALTDSLLAVNRSFVLNGRIKGLERVRRFSSTVADNWPTTALIRAAGK